MVITSLIGGLGNQMFQYAAGRALSLERDVPLLLDVSAFLNYQLHQGFELERIFNCKCEIASENDVEEVLGWQYSSGVRRVLSRTSMAAFRGKTFALEPHFHYWNGIKKAPSDCYLAGYWQSDKYFSAVADQIREDFSFKLPMSLENFEISSEVRKTESVSLHVRRGDYISNINNIKTYAACSIDYYRDAINCILSRLESPCFYIFSDDVDWVRRNLKIECRHRYVVNNSSSESFNDMRLMSLCNHHIIANSSFSWWGAWLNADPDKIVIAPKRWFINENITRDLLPSEWVTL
jgi:hypothetical protein